MVRIAFAQLKTRENIMRLRQLQFAGIFAAAMLLAGCQTDSSNSSQATAKATPQAVELGGTHWQLVELVSSDDAIGTVRPADPTQYRMHLNADGTANLKLDCNRANGPWSSVKSADGVSGVFNIGPAAMTRAMCAPGSLDQRIGRELQYIRSYVIKDGKLNLSMMADGGIQVWEPISGE
jgi:heat shock protein HslJ